MKQKLPKLGIRGRIIFYVSVALILFFILEAAVLNIVFLNGFKNAERENMVLDIQRVEGLLNDQINNYSNKIADWSSWDDTYNFIIDKNQAYIESNLVDGSLYNLKINFMIFIATNGAIIKEKGTNFETKNDQPIPKEYNDLLSKPNDITVHKTLDSKSKGIIRLSNGFVLFASRPILTSSSEGPIRGTLIFSRYIDKEFLNNIGLLNRSKLEIVDYNSKILPKDFTDVKKQLLKAEYKEPNGDLDSYYIKEISLNNIAGYTIIKDYFGKPAFIVKNVLKRPFYSLGNQTIQFSLSLFIIVSLFSLLFAFILLDNLVLSRVKKLNKDVNEFKDKTNPKQRIDVKGSDELSNLSKNINQMLDQISKSNEDLKNQSEILKKKVEDLEKFQNLTVGRELKMIELKKQIEELKKLKS